MKLAPEVLSEAERDISGGLGEEVGEEGGNRPNVK